MHAKLEGDNPVEALHPRSIWYDQRAMDRGEIKKALNW